jgi:hypothetical protein
VFDDADLFEAAQELARAVGGTIIHDDDLPLPIPERLAYPRDDLGDRFPAR